MMLPKNSFLYRILEKGKFMELKYEESETLPLKKLNTEVVKV